MKKCLLIINPYSGKLKIQNELLDIIKILNENDYNTEVQITLSHNHAREIARNIKDKDLVICSGGDGTLNQVVSGLIDGNVDIPLGYIPSGSTNDYANTLGLSFNMKEAVNNIVNGAPHSLDVGCFNNNDYFNYVASFGIFTAASYNTPQSSKNMFGNLAYLFSGIADIANSKPIKLVCEIDGQKFEDEYILGLVLNTTSVAGIMKLNTMDVDLSDGLFEIILIKNPKDLNEYNRIFEGLINCRFTDPVFTFAKAKNVLFYFSEDISWSLDGEEKKGGKVVRITNLNKRIQIQK